MNSAHGSLRSVGLFFRQLMSTETAQLGGLGGFGSTYTGINLIAGTPRSIKGFAP
jgi:hypothetical protein